MQVSMGSGRPSSGGETYFKFGFAPVVDVTPYDIWDGPTAVYPWPSAAATTTLRSDNAADTAAGTGAQAVLVQGLLSDYTEVSELVTMDGVTPVTLTNEFLRINRMFVVSAGSSETNVGIITAQHGATVISNIRLDGSTGRGQTLQTMYTVPKGFVAVNAGITASILRAQAAFAEVAFLVRTQLSIATSPAIRTLAVFGINTQGSSFVAQQRPPALPGVIAFGTGTDIWVRAQDISATVGMSATFTIELVPQPTT